MNEKTESEKKTAGVWVVTAVDYGESCDGKARVLGAFASKEEADNYVAEDIREYVDDNTSDDGECPYVADFGRMSVRTDDADDWRGCEWNVEYVGLPAEGGEK